MQHNISHCGVLSWRSWTCNCVSFWIQFNSRTQVFHLRQENKMGISPVSSTLNLSRTWCCCRKVDNATLHACFCLRVGEHERLIATTEFRRNAIIPCMLLEAFDCRSQSNRPCAGGQGPEQRVLDAWQDSMELQPSMQYEPSCRTNQHFDSGFVQSNGWRTNRLIPRRGHILLHWVFLRLTIRNEERFLLCLLLVDLFPLPLFWENPCLHLCRTGKGENHPSEDHHCLLTSLSCFSFIWTTKQSPLLTTIRDLAPVHRQRMLFRSFWIVLCLFLFPFLLFTWRPLNGLDCQAHSVSSHVQKYDLSSSM